MLRTIFLLTVSVAVVLLYNGQTADARIISFGNPSSSFNISGVNYGSMKWEREHGNRRSLFRGFRRSSFRRR